MYNIREQEPQFNLLKIGNTFSSFETDTLISKEFKLNNIDYYINLMIFDNQNEIFFTKERINTYKTNTGFVNLGVINNINLDLNKDLDSITLFNNEEYNLNYLFFRDILGSRNNKPYKILEISNDGLELRLYSNTFDKESVLSYISEFETRDFEPFYITDLFNSQFVECVNIQYDEIDNSILIKLSKSFDSLNIQDEVYFIELLSLKSFSVINEVNEELISETKNSLLPNFNIEINDEINNESNFTNLNSLLQTNFTSSFSLNNLFNSNVKINVNYENFDEFIFFSSLESRIKSFYLKVQTLENINNNLLITPTNNLYLNQKETILNNLDDFEKYLFYESGSITFPKNNSTPPYFLQSTGTLESVNWYSNMLLSGSNYDESNKDLLRNFLPNYILEQPNQTAGLFTDLLSLNFDKIWLYIKDITNKYNNDNRINVGISKDLISDVLVDFGLKIYQNKYSNNDLLTSFLGINNNGISSYFPDITNQLPVSSSLQYIDNIITGSNFSEQEIKISDLNARIYKRLYNNISYLSKKKGTLDGLRTLINIYGLPSTILRINEFGGRDNKEQLDWDTWNDTFNYSFNTNITNSLFTDWIVNPNWNSNNNRPENVVIRFKSNLIEPTYSFSQSIWSLIDINQSQSLLELNHNPQFSQSLYNGYPLNSDSQYSELIFYPDKNDLNTSCSLYLPFHNNEWWSIKINKSLNLYSIFAFSNHYIGNDGVGIGFNNSSSINSTSSIWDNALTSSLNYDNNFNGNFQEFRYYKSLSLNNFIDFSLNPFSLLNDGNIKDELIFRADLGTEGIISSSIIGESIHSANFGIWETTESFTSNSNYTYLYSSSFDPNRETLFYNYFNAGLKNVISDKFQVIENTLPQTSSLYTQNILSKNVLDLEQTITQNNDRLNIQDINYLEVGFSFQNEINDDIISELGYFNIGDYIGDPKERYSSGNTYSKLDTLSKNFFEKYSNKFRLNDYSRLLNYIDNSLFKLIKDFTPAKTSLTTGHIVKQNLLERNRYKEPTFENNLIELNTNLEIGNFDIFEGAFNHNGFYENLILDDFQLNFQQVINTRKDGVFNLVFTAKAPITSPQRSGFIIYDGIGTTGEIIFQTNTGINDINFNKKINIKSNFITIQEVSSPLYGVDFTNFTLQKYQNNVQTEITPLGYVNKINDNDECFNGQFPGQITVTVTSPKLNITHPEISYKQKLYSGSFTFNNPFMNDLTVPETGFIYLLYDNMRLINGNFVVNINDGITQDIAIENLQDA